MEYVREVTTSPVYRRSLGTGLLLVTVFLWTLSNFLASTLFADNTYSKPFFVTYVNSAFFILPLLPIGIRRAAERAGWPPTADTGADGERGDPRRRNRRSPRLASSSAASGAERALSSSGSGAEEQSPLLHAQVRRRDGSASSAGAARAAGVAGSAAARTTDSKRPLTGRETLVLGAKFSILWFVANWLSSGSFEHTTVASGTILACTSGVWTLLISWLADVERPTPAKVAGVVLSLFGVVLVAREMYADERPVAGDGAGPVVVVPPPGPTFPEKTTGEIMLGNGMALASAFIYGLYSVMMKREVQSESRIWMPLFFGCIGAVSTVVLLPGFAVLDWAGWEPFGLPPDGRVGAIVLVNGTISLVADLAWAYAILLLDSPLVVTLGLSLSIPLSLVGQSVVHNLSVGWMYWLGAGLILGAFLLVKDDDEEEDRSE